jgi:glycogen synthase
VRHALILYHTPVSDEPRVLRQAQALHDAGWRVSVAGLAGQQPAPEFWRTVEIARVLRTPSARDVLRRRVSKWASRFSEGAAERAYWLPPDQAGLFEEAQPVVQRQLHPYYAPPDYEVIYQQLAYVDPGDYDIVLAHDAWMAPVADRLGRKLGIPFSIDVHEYSRGQFMDDRTWRRRERPWIHALQKRFLPRAGAITVIGDGIASLLHEEYGLAEKPAVVRSAAARHDLPFRAAGEQVTVLYHGVVAPTRGLEAAIESVALWRPEFRLVIRGPGTDDYVNGLRALAQRTGVSDRVAIEGPVPASQMIARAHESADIGLFVQPDVSPQKRFTLPNKFFEYVMAGLALAVSDLPEMAPLMKEHDLGVLVGSATPQAIAEAINSLDRDRVDHFKRRSLDAARTLNWETEKDVMLRLYDRLVPPRAAERETALSTA